MLIMWKAGAARFKERAQGDEFLSLKHETYAAG